LLMESRSEPPPDETPPWLRGVEGDQILPVITEDVPVLRVPAGPGTGKTFGLRRRVLRLLHRDGAGCDPSRVLVCAFNRVIAKDLRKEIEAELAPFELEPPVIRTIHGLAGLLAGERPRYLLPHEVETMIYDVLQTNEHVAREYESKFARAMRALRAHEAGMEDHAALAQAADKWVADHGAKMVGDLPRAVEAALRAGDYIRQTRRDARQTQSPQMRQRRSDPPSSTTGAPIGQKGSSGRPRRGASSVGVLERPLEVDDETKLSIRRGEIAFHAARDTANLVGVW
jgi:hypothetical protein